MSSDTLQDGQQRPTSEENAQPDTSAAIALLQNADFSNYRSSGGDDDGDGRDALQTDAPPADKPVTLADDDFEDEDDDEGDQPSSRANRSTDDLSDLREQIAALQKQIQQLTTAGNRATSTESAGGSGVAPPADAGSRLFAKTRAKLEEARAKYGDEMAADLGIPELLDELQAIIEPVHAAARQRQEQEQAEIANAQKQINRYLNSVAQASPEIGRLLGDGKTLSRRQQAFREDVIQTAREIQEQSMRRVRAGRADKPVSDREALDRAVAELTGVSVPRTSTDARVRDRARMVTPAGNGSAGRSQAPTGIAQAEMFINQFLAARRQEDAA